MCSDSDDVAGQSVVGRATHSRRVTQAGREREPGDGCEINGPPTSAAVTDVAYVPGESPRPDRRSGLLSRADGDVSPALRPRDPCRRAPARRARRHHRPSDHGVDGPATPRGLPVERNGTYLLRDRDSTFHAWATTATAMEIHEVVTAPRSPWQNAHAEVDRIDPPRMPRSHHR